MINHQRKLAMDAPQWVLLSVPISGYAWRVTECKGLETEFGTFPVGDDPLDLRPHLMIRGRSPGKYTVLLESCSDLAPSTPDAKMRVAVTVAAPTA